MTVRDTFESVNALGPLEWSYADAVNIALDMLNQHEITIAELDSTVKELWEEMMHS